MFQREREGVGKVGREWMRNLRFKRTQTGLALNFTTPKTL